MLNNTPTTRGRVIAASARSGGRALKQERVPHLRSGDVSVARARGCWNLCAYTSYYAEPQRPNLQTRKRCYWPVPETLFGLTIDTRTFINIEEPTKTATLLVR